MTSVPIAVFVGQADAQLMGNAYQKGKGCLVVVHETGAPGMFKFSIPFSKGQAKKIMNKNAPETQRFRLSHSQIVNSQHIQSRFTPEPRYR